jgi:hypothetical protein
MVFTWQEAKRLEEAQLRAQAERSAAGALRAD